MEASSAFRRCARQSLARPACWRFESRTKSTSESARQQITRNLIRTFSSTTQTRQSQPPQPVPVSNEKNLDQAVGALPSSADGPVKPDPRTRIDLSSLPGIQTSKQPSPTNTTTSTSTSSSTPATAREKLNALFRDLPRSNTNQEDPYTKAIRTTNALNNPPTRTQRDTTTLNIRTLLDEIGPATKKKIRDNEDSKLPLRLRPTLGRTLPVDHARGVDVTRAFRQLDMKCSANNVKKDANAQRFHVRRGQARKLKRSLRWRVQFRAGFLEECARIRRMKNQGW